MNGVFSTQVLLFPINRVMCKWNKDSKISSLICLAVVYGFSAIHVYFLFAVFLLIFLHGGFIVSGSLSMSLCSTTKLSVQNCLHRQNLTSHRDFLQWDTLKVLHFPLQEVRGGIEEFISFKISDSKTIWLISDYRTHTVIEYFYTKRYILLADLFPFRILCWLCTSINFVSIIIYKIQFVL